ncbi:glutathione S-transferase family protein [Yunchengibacter salinarum]|uniref:glutathione S-transferase family protein n=1 Tax=Yunchengibacter salinarum TaxID=3133399 RepID=UPI0035B60A82
MALTLHHLKQSRSRRLVWLVAELGADVDVVSYDRNPETGLAPEDLQAAHPLGKAPVLTGDDGLKLAESGAIAQYLLARFDGGHHLHPREDDADFPRYLEWMHAAEGSPFLPGLIAFYLQKFDLSDSPLAAYMESERAKAVAHVERHLGQHAYFAGGSFTAADCMMGFMLDMVAASGALDSLPAIKGWHARIADRPGYQAMLQVGG